MELREMISTCLRCGRDARGRMGRRRKFCDDCRDVGHVGYHLRLLLLHLEEMPGDQEIAELTEIVASWRERLGVGEDVYPLDGGPSTAEYSLKLGVPREAWPELRALRGSAAR